MRAERVPLSSGLWPIDYDEFAKPPRRLKIEVTNQQTNETIKSGSQQNPNIVSDPQTFVSQSSPTSDCVPFRVNIERRSLFYKTLHVA